MIFLLKIVQLKIKYEKINCHNTDRLVIEHLFSPLLTLNTHLSLLFNCFNFFNN